MLLAIALAQAVSSAVGVPPAAQEGVTSYPASFFAARQPSNAEDMVTRVPGFTIDDGSGVRGYEGAAGNVLVDGQRPATKNDALVEILRRIPANDVLKIEVIRGGAPGIDMQGQTVLANVIRKQRSGVHGTVALGDSYLPQDGRQMPGIRIEAGGGKPGRSWDFSARANTYIDDTVGDGPLTVTDGTGRIVQAGKIHGRTYGIQPILFGAVELPDFGGTLGLHARLLWDNFRYGDTDEITVPTPSFQRDYLKQNKFDTEFGARDTRPISARSSLETVVLRQSEKLTLDENFSSPTNLTDFKLRQDTSELILRSSWKHQHSQELSWEVGAEGADNILKAQTRLIDNGQAIEIPAADVRVEELRGEAFVKATWQVTRTVSLEAALRQEGSRISSSGDVQLSKTLYYTKPRLLLTWKAAPQTQLRVRIEREVGQLSFNDFVASSSLLSGFVTVGNPNLIPEQAWVGEVSLDQHFLTSGIVSLTYRYSSITDAIDRAPIFAPSGVFDAPANIGNGRKTEYILQATLPLSRLGVPGAELRGSGAFRESEVTDPTTGKKREISGLHHLDWDLHFTQDIPRLGLTWGIDVTGARRQKYYRFDQIEVKTLGAYVVPYVEWRPKPDWTWRFELQNAARHGLRDQIIVWQGVRGASPIEVVQDRDPHVGMMPFVRFRKTFR